MKNKEVELEIDFFDDNEHIQEKDDRLIIQLTEFPDGYVGKIEQEFEETFDKKGKTTGKFEEFVFKEIIEEEW